MRKNVLLLHISSCSDLGQHSCPLLCSSSVFGRETAHWKQCASGVCLVPHRGKVSGTGQVINSNKACFHVPMYPAVPAG